MEKKLVGQVSLDERNEIQKLFERRNGLSELAKILTPDNSELYDKVVKDLGDTGMNFQKWWNVMSEKYDWERSPDGNWEIDFETCNIYLIHN
ncbi:MAG: CXXX repeat peptide modification system protein [Bacteroidales bacterium]|nr:CXXX repeat peptide modification system protein [Bacteroidales bacterium]